VPQPTPKGFQGGDSIECGIAGEECCIRGADARPNDEISVNAALYKRTQHADVR